MAKEYRYGVSRREESEVEGGGIENGGGGDHGDDGGATAGGSGVRRGGMVVYLGWGVLAVGVIAAWGVLMVTDSGGGGIGGGGYSPPRVSDEALRREVSRAYAEIERIFHSEPAKKRYRLGGGGSRSGSSGRGKWRMQKRINVYVREEGNKFGDQFNICLRVLREGAGAGVRVELGAEVYERDEVLGIVMAGLKGFFGKAGHVEIRRVADW